MDWLQVGTLLLIFIATVALAYWALSMTAGNPTANRLRGMVGIAPDASSSGDKFLDKVAQATKPLAKLSTPEEGFQASPIRLRFMNAGIRTASAPIAYFGAKTFLALALPLLAFLVLSVLGRLPKGNSLLLLLLLIATIGYYLPNGILSHMVETRQREIFENFPDALDLMTVSVEAGLGTEAAMNRVAEEMAAKSTILSDELRLVNLELRAGAPRERALRNLALRTGVEEVDGFVSMIVQSERFGTSVAKALRVHSDMLRTRRRQRAEEAAAKIALKLLFPLIFCIFPTLLLVLMGPAMIQIYRILLPTMSGQTGG
jgi:tight adherence protein C